MTAKIFSENSKLSGRLPTFVKQGVGAKNGKCGLDRIFCLNTSQDINNIIPEPTARSAVRGY